MFNPLKSARELIEGKKPDLYHDRVFIKHLVKAVQERYPFVAGVYFDKTGILVICDPAKKIIYDKLLMNKTNLDEITMEEHVKRIVNNVRMIETGLIPLHEIYNPTMREFNKFKTGKII